MFAKERNRILLRVQHVNIQDYFGIFIYDGELVTLSEDIDCQSLYFFMRDEGRNATDLVRINWMRQLANVRLVAHLVG